MKTTVLESMRTLSYFRLDALLREVKKVGNKANTRATALWRSRRVLHGFKL